MGERSGRRVPQAGGLTPPFLAEVEAAAAGVPSARVQRREGFVTVAVELGEVPAGLSERTRSLVEAFPVRDGRRSVTVDVRNRQWAAMLVELLTAVRGAGEPPHPPARGDR